MSYRKIALLTTAVLVLAVFILFFISPHPPASPASRPLLNQSSQSARQWRALSGNRPAKVIFARPPHLYILDLGDGREVRIPRIRVEGGAGRRLRKRTPRPSWSPDGTRFVYRYDQRVFVGDEKGRQQEIFHPGMDRSWGNRWSWFQDPQTRIDYAAGPGLRGDILLVQLQDPTRMKTALSGQGVHRFCEITGTGRYVVYDDGSDIYTTRLGSDRKGIKISEGQSCRPCAAPDDRVAWLAHGHTHYQIHRAGDGTRWGQLQAPPGEEIYRLNWSNHRDFAVHMYGSQGNTRMHVRRISTGDFIYIGEGWDPDLWVDFPGR